MIPSRDRSHKHHRATDRLEHARYVLRSLEGEMMLKRIRVGGFRGIGAPVDVALGPFVALIGPNGVGKSSLIDALRLVADATRLGLPAALDAQGGFACLRRAAADDPQASVTIDLAIEAGGQPAAYRLQLAPVGEHRYRVESEEGRIGNTVFSVRDGAWRGPPGTSPRVDPENLALSLVGGDYRFQKLLEVIRGMECYSFSIESLRQLAARAGRTRMDRRGRGWAAILDEQPAETWKADLIAVLTRLTGDIDDIEVQRLSGFPVVRFHHRSNGRFLEATQESDGTLRVAGILTALLQRPAPSLIAIEEPELAVHPGALGLVVDELRAAATRTQVIITTQSSDILDLLSIDELRVVSSTMTGAAITSVSERQRAIVKEGLFSLGELHRSEGLEPDRPNDD
jgi:energy-coupling factor transporter ATP-binding protein EcfA2